MKIEQITKVLDNHNIDYTVSTLRQLVYAIEYYTTKEGISGQTIQVFNSKTTLKKIKNWLGY
jgi:predicted transcriptional regulator